MAKFFIRALQLCQTDGLFQEACGAGDREAARSSEVSRIRMGDRVLGFRKAQVSGTESEKLDRFLNSGQMPHRCSSFWWRKVKRA